MNKIYPRKKIRFPNGNWRYKYCGKSYDSIKQVKSDRDFGKYVRTWGDGTYELFAPAIGKVIDRLKVSTLHFRATANKNGQPIRPSLYRKKGHIRKPECADCYNSGYLKGFEKGERIGSKKGYKDGKKAGFYQAEEEFAKYLESINRIDQPYFPYAPRPIYLPPKQTQAAPLPEAPAPLGPMPILKNKSEYTDSNSKKSNKYRRDLK
jgi:hypothetical protein